MSHPYKLLNYPAMILVKVILSKFKGNNMYVMKKPGKFVCLLSQNNKAYATGSALKNCFCTAQCYSALFALNYAALFYSTLA